MDLLILRIHNGHKMKMQDQHEQLVLLFLRVVILDPPPLNWSIVIVRNMEEDHYVEEDLQARGDRREAAPG